MPDAVAPAAPAPAAPAAPVVAPAAEAKPEQKTIASLLGAEPVKAPEAPVVPAKPGDAPAAAEPPKLAELILKAPEKSALTDTDIKAITEMAKAKGLTQDQAQAFVDREAARLDEHGANLTKQNTEAFQGLYRTWSEQVSADKDFGGPKQAATIESARRVVAKYADPEFAKILNETPFGSHPGLIRMLARLGQSMREDGVHAGSDTPAAAPVRPADLLYPHFAQK